VRQIDDVRSADGDDAVARRHHAITRREVIGKDCGPNHPSVAAGVFQQPDRAIGLLFRPFLRFLTGRDAANGLIEYAGLIQLENIVIAVAVVTMQLTDVDASASVETHPGRFSQLRLGGDELDTETVRQAKALEALFRLGTLGSIGGRWNLLGWKGWPQFQRTCCPQKGQHRSPAKRAKPSVSRKAHVARPPGAGKNAFGDVSSHWFSCFATGRRHTWLD